MKKGDLVQFQETYGHLGSMNRRGYVTWTNETHVDLHLFGRGEKMQNVPITVLKVVPDIFDQLLENKIPFAVGKSKITLMESEDFWTWDYCIWTWIEDKPEGFKHFCGSKRGPKTATSVSRMGINYRELNAAEVEKFRLIKHLFYRAKVDAFGAVYELKELPFKPYYDEQMGKRVKRQATTGACEIKFGNVKIK